MADTRSQDDGRTLTLDPGDDRTGGPDAFSIVIAAKNEEQTIGRVLQGVRRLTDDLIVVDGRSSDRTAAIAEAHGARVMPDGGKGKGEAIRRGLAAVRHPIAVFLDADGSHDPNDIPALVDPIARGEADLVMGSRMLGGSEELFGAVAEVIRCIGGLMVTLLINYRFGVRLTDYENGFRAIRTDVARAIGLTSDLPTIEQEMAIKCLRLGYRVAERSTHEYRRQGGRSKIHILRMGPYFVWQLLCGLMVPRPRRSVARSRVSADERIAR